MERRVTRSIAASEAVVLSAQSHDVKDSRFDSKLAARQKKNSSPGKARKRKRALVDDMIGTDSITEGRRPKRHISEVAANKLLTVNDLPHILGKAANISPTIKGENSFAQKGPTTESKLGQLAVDKATKTVRSRPDGKRKKKNSYGLTPGYSPFPHWARPTAEECEEVNRLLSSVHGEAAPPKTIPKPSLAVTGCGEVPSVLDALIRTLLSGATTAKNSAMAFDGLVKRFGILEEGAGKGSVNWDAVRQAPVADVFEAIKSGGLADMKSRNLKAILEMVHKENLERRDPLLEDIKIEPDEAKQFEVERAGQSFLSLNHLHSLSKEEVMRELMRYPGIGPKTAACVVLFCLQRPCFAVDTHVFRICKWLGWIPPSKVTEIMAFSHLEVRIPDHLKYSLHKLFVLHGRSCPRCRAITSQSSAGWENGCIIDHLVTRSGKRKGRAVAPSGKKAGHF